MFKYLLLSFFIPIQKEKTIFRFELCLYCVKNTKYYLILLIAFAVISLHFSGFQEDLPLQVFL